MRRPLHFVYIPRHFMAKNEKEGVEKTVITQVTHIEETQAKKAYIMFLSGPLMGKMINIADGQTIIGRAPDAGIVINDQRISRHHLKLEHAKDAVTISDLGSTNGTFVNGVRITAPQKLSDGDKIQISSVTIFKFAFEDETGHIFQEEFYKMAILDPVTNIHNKRFFLNRLKEEFSLSKRGKMNLSILMIDIDFFKKVNDTHGHLAGDMILNQLAKIFKTMVRNEDILARYGGEEFIVALRSTNLEGSKILAERIRKKVEETPLTFEDKKIPITISIGVASLDEGCEHKDIDAIIKDADAKLYKSKENGRNRVTV